MNLKTVSVEKLKILKQLVPCDITQEQTLKQVKFPNWRCYENLPEHLAPIEVESIAQYSLLVSAHRLEELINIVEQHHRHQQVQQRYPQLRDAWMDYYTQVLLTVNQNDGYF